MHDFYVTISYWLDPFFLIYFSIINVYYMILMVLGSWKIFRRSREIEVEDFTQLLQSNSLPAITLIVPSYNEGSHIKTLVSNLINLSYRSKRIILVNDGSTDDSLKILQDHFDLVTIPFFFENILPTKPIRQVYRSKSYPELIVVDKENGKRHDALNAGLNLCQTPFFISVDADTYIDDTYFESLIRPIYSSPESIGMGATVRIGNGCTIEYNRVNSKTVSLNYVIGMQTLEYIRTFIMRQGWDYVGGNFCISGAFSIYSTEIVKELGGYTSTFANDLEIVLRLNRGMILAKIPYKITYLPDPVAWTDGPESIKELDNQRNVWQRATLESIWYHKCMLFNPRYKRYGFVIFPFLVLGEALEPLVEIVGYLYIIAGICLGIVSYGYVVLLLSIIWVFTILYTLACLFIEVSTFQKYTDFKTLVRLSFFTFIECLGYRQLTLFWRAKGSFAFLKEYRLNQKEARVINQLMENFLKLKGSKNGKS